MVDRVRGLRGPLWGVSPGAGDAVAVSLEQGHGGGQLGLRGGQCLARRRGAQLASDASIQAGVSLSQLAQRGAERVGDQSHVLGAVRVRVQCAPDQGAMAASTSEPSWQKPSHRKGFDRVVTASKCHHKQELAHCWHTETAKTGTRLGVFCIG